MRTLKRGARGEDVLLWQQFLVHLRKQGQSGFIPPLTRVDGIFGLETARATQAFQRFSKLPTDGVVGNATYQKARQLGFLEAAGTPLTPGSEPIAPVLGPLMGQIKAEPLLEGDSRSEASSAERPGKGSSVTDSHQRCRAESWKDSKIVNDGLKDGDATFQLLKDGAGDYVYDSYSIEVERMPKDKSAEAFLDDMAADLNGTIGNGDFDDINVFTRRRKGKPKIGEIIDIDIVGPNNGSVILVEKTATYFIFQTVESKKLGSHPENGCREFGFERAGGGFRFYTRGVSRPGNYIFRVVGSVPQKMGWTSLMEGIAAKINKLGGKANPSVQSKKDELPR
jgi:putative peptidoglycan binding protein